MPTIDLIEKALETATPFRHLLITLKLPLMKSREIMSQARTAGVIDLNPTDLNNLGPEGVIHRQIEIRPTNRLAGSDWVAKLADVITHIENTEPVFKKKKKKKKKTGPDLAEAS